MCFELYDKRDEYLRAILYQRCCSNRCCNMYYIHIVHGFGKAQPISASYASIIACSHAPAKIIVAHWNKPCSMWQTCVSRRLARRTRWPHLAILFRAFSDWPILHPGAEWIGTTSFTLANAESRIPLFDIFFNDDGIHDNCTLTQQFIAWRVAFRSVIINQGSESDRYCHSGEFSWNTCG